MERLPHGYTNRSRRAGGHVEKTYLGRDRFDNARRELACLSSLARDDLPVATVVRADLAVPQVVLGVMPGRHGQELIDEGRARVVLRLVGATVATLQRVPSSAIPGLTGDGPVIVHGDLGPQNMLFDVDGNTVTGVLDWERAHRGDPVEDLAWAEWIVRMHHPRAADALDELFLGAGSRPPWTVRHDEMVRQVGDLLAQCETTDSRSTWRDRVDVTEGWTE